MNIFNFGSDLREILLNDENISNAVGTKVFPLVASEKTTFPFIIYQRSSTYGDYNKDYLTGYNVNVDIIIFSDKYKDVVDLSTKVDNCIQQYWNKARTKPHLVGSTENFDMDTYYCTLSYEFKL